jgi:FtsP/CotA-like multicopper oxidase with cupredoxin domain
MSGRRTYILPILGVLLITLGGWPCQAAVHVQCPGDTDGDAVIDSPDPSHPLATCMHLTAGDGYVNMADGELTYVFGFSDATGVFEDMVMDHGMLGAQQPAPTIAVKEGQELYLTLTNAGMMMRPDLFDPHTVHWHGFPNAAPIFDGMPGASIAINMGASLTYYYKVFEPGTFLYHCHVEATEHMQMGMIGNLYVTPAQNDLPEQYFPNGFHHVPGNKYVYNDGDGSTSYDVEIPLQMTSFDPLFHAASEAVQPLPFQEMYDTYAMLNGRGYPDTVNPNILYNSYPGPMGGKPSQPVSSLITATVGQNVLLRLSNVSTTDFYTVTVLGIPMRVVGRDARLLRGPTGKDLSYSSNSVTLGGGETNDVILDTAAVSPGTYFVYTTNLNHLSNNGEDFGGLMTEIVLNPGP